MLPLSHDEVVHGKKSIVNKMPGFFGAQLANVRALYSYQTLHPGKKLNFMGNEFAQGLEWRFYEQLEWQLLNSEENKKIQDYCRALNKLYLKENALWEDSWDTFEWIEHENNNGNTISFLRKTKDGSKKVIGLFNFSGENKIGYKIGVPENKIYRVILNSDDEKYGGTNFSKRKRYKPVIEVWNGRPQHIQVDIGANSVIFLKAEERKVKEGSEDKKEAEALKVGNNKGKKEKAKERS